MSSITTVHISHHKCCSATTINRNFGGRPSFLFRRTTLATAKAITVTSPNTSSSQYSHTHVRIASTTSATACVSNLNDTSNHTRNSCLEASHPCVLVLVLPVRRPPPSNGNRNYDSNFINCIRRATSLTRITHSQHNHLFVVVPCMPRIRLNPRPAPPPISLLPGLPPPRPPRLARSHRAICVRQATGRQRRFVGDPEQSPEPITRPLSVAAPWHRDKGASNAAAEGSAMSAAAVAIAAARRSQPDVAPLAARAVAR